MFNPPYYERKNPIRRFLIFVLALLASTALSASLASCSSSLKVSPYSSPTPTPTNTPKPSEPPTLTATATPTEVAMPPGLENLPPGITAVHNENGSWGIGIDEGEQTKAIPGILVDATGLHLNLEGSIVDIPQSQIGEKLQVGVFGNLQILNAEKNLAAWAYDQENQAWIDGSTVIQPDKSNPENYIKIQTWDDIKELARPEKLVLTAFPENTYFPPLDKIFKDYDMPINKGDPSAEFSRLDPLGKLPAGMEWSLRVVNSIVLEKNENEGRKYDSLIFTEQVWNPDDKSFSVVHYGGYTNREPAGSQDFISTTSSDWYFLPVYRFPIATIPEPIAHNVVSYLQKNGYMDSSGNMPKIQQLVEEWFRRGHVPAELENIVIPYLPFRK
jgi:hypothetical protein